MGYDQHIVSSAERAELRQFGRGSKRKQYHFEPAGELFNGLEFRLRRADFSTPLRPCRGAGARPL